MPCVRPQACLQRIVVGDANALDLVDRRELRERGEVWPKFVLIAANRGGSQGRRRRLIDVAHDQQPAALTRHVPDLKYSCRVDLILNVQPVVLSVSVLEILAN